MADYEVRDVSLAPSGRSKIDWVSRFMPVLNMIRREFERERPLSGVRIACCLHLEMKTAYLVEVLAAGGAEVAVCGANPLSTQDDVAAALAAEGISVFAVRGEGEEDRRRRMRAVLETRPDVIIDDGADLVAEVHSAGGEALERVVGASEETTSGVIRLRAMERRGALRFPVVAVNDSMCKFLFDNRYGTGQSTWDGVMRATNLLLAGKTVVIAGYGWVGRGLASRARGLGAEVIVTEVDPIRALEARMEGYRVMPMSEAARVGDVFVTATGNVDVLRGEHFAVMRDGAVLANAGHFGDEISSSDLEEAAAEVRRPRPSVTEYLMPDGRRIYLLADGQLVNLAAADGHPAEIMDMSFALQALAARYLVERGRELGPGVHRLPEEIDRRVAEMKLESMGIEIDELTEGQRRYLESWRR